MAGARLRLDYEMADREIAQGLQRLARQGADMRDAFGDIGEELLNSTRRRFELEQAPDGTSWPALDPAYRRRKDRNADKILQYQGFLFGTLDYRPDTDHVAVGSPLIYAATHQFGDEERGIPARPFLGLSEDDREQVVDILQRHLRRALHGG